MDSYRKLMGNSVVFAIGNFGSKIITLILVPLYTYYLTSSEYGTVDLITITASLLLPIISANIFEATLRFAIEKDSNQKKVISNSMYVAKISTLISLVLIPLFQLFLNNYKLSFFMIILIIVQLYRSIFSQYARGSGAVKVFAIDGIIMTFIIAISNIVFLTVFDWGLTGYLLSLVLANVGSIIYLVFILNIHRLYSKKLIDKNYIKEMLKYAIPLIPNSIMWWLINASNRYFILFFLSASSNGLFAVSTKIPGVLNIISNIFSQAWQLSAIEEYESKDKDRFYATVFDAYSSLLFLVSGAVIVVLKLTMKFIFAEEYFSSWETIPFLLLGVIFSSLAAFLAANYLASKETNGVFKTSIYSGFISLILNVILIPTFGLMGAAIGNMISFLFMFIIRYYDTRKYVSLAINKSKFIINIIMIFMLTFIQFIDFPLVQELVILSLIYIIQIVINMKLVLTTLKIIKAFLKNKKTGR